MDKIMGRWEVPTTLLSPYELATNPSLLHLVEEILPC